MTQFIIPVTNKGMECIHKNQTICTIFIFQSFHTGTVKRLHEFIEEHARQEGKGKSDQGRYRTFSLHINLEKNKTNKTILKQTHELISFITKI